MQKTQKEKAIKQLHAEMKEEKQAEIKRCAVQRDLLRLSLISTFTDGKRLHWNVKRLLKSGVG